ncbi:MAG: hypothetical protein GEEBNDBF_00387 [bacterium]|nr:hypothetical protein [bacterium]
MDSLLQREERTLMRKVTWAGIGLIVLSIYGCSRGSGPLTPGGPASAPLPTGGTIGTRVITGASTTSPLGLFTFAVDAAQGTAEVTLSRQGEASDNLYELSIEDFTTSDTIKVESVDVTPTTVDLKIRVTHPIPAPTNLDGPTSSRNRADLGAALRLLLLHDVQATDGNTFFANDDPVIANTAVIANAHGFFKPAGLVQLPPSFKANTFPYLLVVDEAANDGTGNRDGVAGIAGAFGQGNYDPALGGWQRHNIGPANNGWTGYGLLHQGQAALLNLRLHRTDLAAGEQFTFDAVLLAKYLDPRGGNTGSQRRGNRLPKADGDPVAFAYRMPYGALDLEAVMVHGESGGWRPDLATSTTMQFHVRDWDAFAGETTLSELMNEPNLAMNQIGGSGFPAIWIDVPEILSEPVAFDSADMKADDTAFGGDPTIDTGMPGDALFFQKTLTKPAGSGQVPGTYWGMLRLVDPEDFDSNRSSYTTPVDKNLVPLAEAVRPRVRTYQKISFLVANPNGAPTATAMFAGGVTNVISGGSLQAQVLSYNDPETEPGSFTIDYDVTDGFFPEFAPQTITGGSSFPVALQSSGMLANNASVTSVNRVAQIRYTDNNSAPRTIYLPYVISGNQPPTGDAMLPYQEYEVGSLMELILSNVSDPENNPILISIDWEWDGTEGGFQPDPGYDRVTMNQAMQGRPAIGTPGNWLVGVRIIDPLHPNGVIIAIPYRSVPPNTLPVATFSTPGTVESATTTTVTCLSLQDPDGDPITVEIDWNGDGDFDDEGESGLPTMDSAGTIYTSPVLKNTTSASPLAPRMITVRYTDNVAPHPWQYAEAGEYILGGNRKPIVSGALSLEESPLATPAAFKVLQNTGTVTDPEGDPITFTLRAVPNSGSASNTSFTAFPRTSSVYTNPSVSTITFTVYANDPLHGSTSGTAWPALSAQLCGVYVETWNFDASNQGWLPGFGGLPNTDNTNWSAWTWCPASGQGLSGNIWTTGPDSAGPCNNHPDDYGGNVNNNLVSPSFSLAAASKANLVFNSSMSGRGGTTCHYRIYVSTDNGTNWHQVYDYTKSSSSKQNNSNMVVSLNNFTGAANVRVRFQLQDTSADTWGMSPYAGWSIDTVRITACP